MRLLDRCRAPGALRVARVGVGIACTLQAYATVRNLALLGRPEMLRTPRIDVLPLPTGPALWVFAALWVGAGLAFVAGRRTRSAGVVLCTTMGYALLLDHQLYSNHLYLFLLLCGLLTAAAGESSSWWPLLLIRFQIPVVYLFSGISKLNEEFLSGEVLRAAVPGGWVQGLPYPVVQAAAWGTVAAELFLAAGLPSRRLRRWAVALGLAFHGAIALVLRSPGVILFGLATVSTYPLFFVSPVAGPQQPNLERAEPPARPGPLPGLIRGRSDRRP